MRGSAVNLQAALMVSSTPFSPTEEADWNASERTLLQGNPKSGVGSKNETLRKNLVPGINCILLAVFCHSDHHTQCYACGVDSHVACLVSTFFFSWCDRVHLGMVIPLGKLAVGSYRPV